MPRINLPPTKSNLLLLRRQLALAEEGYDLLDQKRQILVLELRQRLGPASLLEEKLGSACQEAFRNLREATLDAGAAALDRAVVAIAPPSDVEIAEQRLVGLRLPRVTIRGRSSLSGPIGVERWVNAEAARAGFEGLLPQLARLAEHATVVLRLAREVRRTQRRCNALSKIYIPDRREAVSRIAATLEERERESLGVLKLIRDRVRGDE